MDRRSESRRKADVDWLYGNDDSVDHTRVLDESEQAELDRRRAELAGSAPVAAARAGADAARQADDQPRQRVVHTEDQLAGVSRPASRPAAPAARPAPRPTPSAPPRPAPRPQAATPPPVEPPAARPVAPRPPRRRRFGLARLLVPLLVAWLAYLVAVPVISVSRMPKTDETPAGSRPADQPGTLTLLIGSDERENLTAAQKKRLGTGSEVGKRTDTMMLLFQPKSGKPALMSLPRDSYVEIPGYGHNKLNAAYALGGPKLLVQTIEADTGLRVDNYLEIGFDGFANIIDALGGIEMCLPNAIKDKDSHINLPAGCQNLDGVNALGYVRMRKADPEGDIGRAKRQRQMVAAVAKKAINPMTVLNPVRYWKVGMAGGQALTRGQDTSVTEVAGALNAMRTVGDQGLTLTVPVSSTNTTTSAGSSVIWDEEGCKELFGTMAQGTTKGLEKFQK